MTTKIFVNLPVKNLAKSIEFFKEPGFSFNQQFTDETAACMVISDDIYAMLLTEAKFKESPRRQSPTPPKQPKFSPACPWPARMRSIASSIRL